MSRLLSQVKMGYYPIEEQHYPAILSLVTPATPAHKLLDPFAGEGAFLEAAARAWGMTPYANELDGERAEQCIARFGPKQAVRCDAERLSASTGAFSLGWFNPPYAHDRAAPTDAKRVEFRLLRHSWKWIQPGGLVLWVIYRQHLTDHAAGFLSKHTARVDVWALPGKHLTEYDQIVVAAVPGRHPNPAAHYADILEQKALPLTLTVQAEPVYRLPSPPKRARFIFAPDTVDEAQGLRLLEAHGAWTSNGFQALLQPPPPPSQIVPVVAPRPGHTALVLAAGVADGAVIDTTSYGTVAIRGKTEPVEQVARVEVESDAPDSEHPVTKTVMKLKPSTTLTLLSGDGTTVEMEGDEALLDFITTNKTALADYLNEKFSPVYQFDLNGIGRFLSRVRLNGKYPLYTAQKHVIAAITKGFEHRKGILLSGMMGTGKTAMGSSAAAAIASGAVTALAEKIGDEQIILIVAPPHLTDKWKRELLSIHPNSVVERLDRHEDVKAFMDKAATLGAGMPKVGIIKRDLTKLGCAREPAVVWREQPVALWPPSQPTPEGYQPADRVTKQRVPQCPGCGATVTRERKGTRVPASQRWLKTGKRTCETCHTPLWQQARDRGARPKPGEKYPPKNPRFRLDAYIKRNYPDRVYLLVWDECHEAANISSGNGEAFGRLAGVADKVLGLTGTPFNGRASSLFNLAYHLTPRVRQQYPWGGADRLSRKQRGARTFQTVVESAGKQRGRSEARWVADMGVRERVVEERPTYDRETGAYTGTSTYERPYEEAPGISPLLVAEMLDYTIYFSLKDLGKSLPRYEEIALPVEMDTDTYAQYDRTRAMLKEYLVQRKWEGDNSFRGAFLQWSMGWPNAAFRPTEVIHNIKSPVTGKKRPHTVTRIPSFGEERIYAKEQALIDLLTEELKKGRPCVVYLRQTGTRDIQPRIERVIREHVPDAVPYVLKNTVGAERREKVINQQVEAGINILIANPELTKTGLDLLHFPTLIFMEITFSLSTMMQASARAYRLNQTHAVCKTVYMFAQGTMEHTAVQLMSRKQRAAKLLTGDLGLTGLDALTEGESGFESALMDAIAKDDALLDPSALFKSDTGNDYNTEDAAFWNVETEPDESATSPDAPTTGTEPTLRLLPAQQSLGSAVRKRVQTAGLTDEARVSTVVARVVTALTRGVPHPSDGDRMQCEGTTHPDFARYPVHAEQLTKWLTKYLRSKKVAVDPETLKALAHDLVQLAATKAGIRLPTRASSSAKRRTPDRLAVPDDVLSLPSPPRRRTSAQSEDRSPHQPTLFPLTHDYTG